MSVRGRSLCLAECGAPQWNAVQRSTVSGACWLEAEWDVDARVVSRRRNAKLEGAHRAQRVGKGRNDVLFLPITSQQQQSRFSAWTRSLTDHERRDKGLISTMIDGGFGRWFSVVLEGIVASRVYYEGMCGIGKIIRSGASN